MCVLSAGQRRLRQKSRNNYVNQRKPRILCPDHVLGILKVVIDGLESKVQVYCLELSVLVEEDLRFKDSVKICKVYQALGRGYMKFFCKWTKNMSHKLV